MFCCTFPHLYRFLAIMAAAWLYFLSSPVTGDCVISRPRACARARPLRTAFHLAAALGAEPSFLLATGRQPGTFCLVFLVPGRRVVQKKHDHQNIIFLVSERPSPPKNYRNSYTKNWILKGWHRGSPPPPALCSPLQDPGLCVGFSIWISEKVPGCLPVANAFCSYSLFKAPRAL